MSSTLSVSSWHDCQYCQFVWISVRADKPSMHEPNVLDLSRINSTLLSANYSAHILSNSHELVLERQRCTYVKKGVLLLSKNNPYLNGGISENSLFLHQLKENRFDPSKHSSSLFKVLTRWSISNHKYSFSPHSETLKFCWFIHIWISSVFYHPMYHWTLGQLRFQTMTIENFWG